MPGRKNDAEGSKEDDDDDEDYRPSKKIEKTCLTIEKLKRIFNYKNKRYHLRTGKTQNYVEDLPDKESPENELSHEKEDVPKMEHYKKRLIQQHEKPVSHSHPLAESTEQNRSPAGKKDRVKKVKKQRAICRSQYRHTELPLIKLGTGVSSSLCKTKEPYNNICAERNLKLCIQRHNNKYKSTLHEGRPKETKEISTTEYIINAMNNNNNSRTKDLQIKSSSDNKAKGKGKHILPAIVPDVSDDKSKKLKKHVEKGKSIAELQNSPINLSMKKSSQASTPPIRKTSAHQQNIQPLVAMRLQYSDLHQNKTPPAHNSESATRVSPKSAEAPPATNSASISQQSPTADIELTSGSIGVAFPEIERQITRLANTGSSTEPTDTASPVIGYTERVMKAIVDVVVNTMEIQLFSVELMLVLNKWYRHLSKGLAVGDISTEFKSTVRDEMNEIIFFISNRLFGTKCTIKLKNYLREIMNSDLSPHADFLKQHIPLTEENCENDLWMRNFVHNLIKKDNRNYNILPSVPMPPVAEAIPAPIPPQYSSVPQRPYLTAPVHSQNHAFPGQSQVYQTQAPPLPSCPPPAKRIRRKSSAPLPKASRPQMSYQMAPNVNIHPDIIANGLSVQPVGNRHHEAQFGSLYQRDVAATSGANEWSRPPPGYSALPFNTDRYPSNPNLVTQSTALNPRTFGDQYGPMRLPLAARRMSVPTDHTRPGFVPPNTNHVVRHNGDTNNRPQAVHPFADGTSQHSTYQNVANGTSTFANHAVPHSTYQNADNVTPTFSAALPHTGYQNAATVTSTFANRAVPHSTYQNAANVRTTFAERAVPPRTTYPNAVNVPQQMLQQAIVVSERPVKGLPNLNGPYFTLAGQAGVATDRTVGRLPNSNDPNFLLAGQAGVAADGPVSRLPNLTRPNFALGSQASIATDRPVGRLPNSTGPNFTLAGQAGIRNDRPVGRLPNLNSPSFAQASAGTNKPVGRLPNLNSPGFTQSIGTDRPVSRLPDLNTPSFKQISQAGSTSASKRGYSPAPTGFKPNASAIQTGQVTTQGSSNTRVFGSAINDGSTATFADMAFSKILTISNDNLLNKPKLILKSPSNGSPEYETQTPITSTNSRPNSTGNTTNDSSVSSISACGRESSDVPDKTGPQPTSDEGNRKIIVNEETMKAVIVNDDSMKITRSASIDSSGGTSSGDASDGVVLEKVEMSTAPAGEDEKETKVFALENKRRKYYEEELKIMKKILKEKHGDVYDEILRDVQKKTAGSVVILIDEDEEVAGKKEDSKQSTENALSENCTWHVPTDDEITTAATSVSAQPLQPPRPIIEDISDEETPPPPKKMRLPNTLTVKSPSKLSADVQINNNNTLVPLSTPSPLRNLLVGAPPYPTDSAAEPVSWRTWGTGEDLQNIVRY